MSRAERKRLALRWFISGGQAGADRGGLLAAEVLGLRTGGWAPRGWLSEDNAGAPLLRDRFGLQECLVGDSRASRYRARTKANVEAADMTLIFGRLSPGSCLTRDCAARLGRTWVWFTADNADERSRLRYFVFGHRPRVVNIAGNRESKNPGIEKRVRRFLSESLLGDIVKRRAKDEAHGGSWLPAAEAAPRIP